MGVTVKMTWNGAAINAAIQKKVAGAMRQAVGLAVGMISLQVRGTSGIGNAVIGTGRGAGQGVPPVFRHSQPGQPPHSITGGLAHSFYGSVVQSGPVTSAAIRSDSSVAHYMEYGTRPHWILPRNARVLVFGGGGGGWMTIYRVYHGPQKARHGPIGGMIQRMENVGGVYQGTTAIGRWVYTPYVYHPGTAPRPFIQSTLQKIRPAITSILHSAIAPASSPTVSFRVEAVP